MEFNDSKIDIVLYVPSDTPEAMAMSTAKVAGVPVIVRGVMTLAGAGIKRVGLLIAPAQREKVEKFLSRYNGDVLPRVDILNYDEPYRVSPDIVDTLSRDIGSTVTLINANLLFDKDVVSMIQNTKMEGSVQTFMDGIHPIPIIRCKREVWQTLSKFTDEKARSIESCIRNLMQSSCVQQSQKSAAINTFLVKRPRDREVAEKFLTEAIRYSTMGPVARYINKRISLPVSLILSKLWVSPNTITALNIVIGLFSGVFVADGNHYNIILFGAVLFQIASIVDGCDGEVAKLTFRASKFGQYIDSLSDNLSLASFMIGLIAGYWRHTHSYVAFTVGAAMIVFTAITFFWMIRYLKKYTESASLVTFDTEYLQRLRGYPSWLVKFINIGKYTLKKDVFSFEFLLFAVFGVLYSFLFIATLGTFVSATILTYLNVQEWLRSRNQSCVKVPETRGEETA